MSRPVHTIYIAGTYGELRSHLGRNLHWPWETFADDPTRMQGSGKHVEFVFIPGWEKAWREPWRVIQEVKMRQVSGSNVINPPWGDE